MLVDRLIETLLMLGWDGHLCQAKEKFGGLRFYVTRYNGEHSEAMMNIVSLAEHASYSICEVCSDMGTVRGLPWIQTLCDRHFEEAKKPRKFR